MSQQDKQLVKILLGTSDHNIPFDSLRKLLNTLGFEERIASIRMPIAKGVTEI